MEECINDRLAGGATAIASDLPRLENPDFCSCLLATEIETGNEEDMRAIASALYKRNLIPRRSKLSSGLTASCLSATAAGSISPPYSATSETT